MTKPSFSVRNTAIAAVVAALYAALTLLFAPISYGAVQFRIAEALTMLPALLPQSIPGLALGCLLANLLGSATPWDVVFGTLATLLAALLTRHWRKNVWLAATAPVVCNAVVVGLVLTLTLGNLLLLPTVASVGLGEAVVVYALGVPMLLTLSRVPLLRKAGGLADAPASLRDINGEDGSGGGDAGGQA
ncbi:MAG: QueT transporter family protein [Clostridiales bacterium]|nr:QueT transporter family protein [Clostridiales bacterium]